MEKLVLIDGHSILNRAFYGVPGLTNSEGLHTNAVYGFLNILFKLLEEEKPGYLAVAFDLKAPTFRHTAYDGYKATRHGMPEELAQQMPVLKELLTDLGFVQVSKPGWEADDILGTLAAANEAARRTGEPAMAIQLPNGEMVIGKTSELMGCSAAAQLSRRVAVLRALLGALEGMEREIAFRLTPMPELLERAAAESPPPVCTLFARCRTLLDELGERSMAELWREALEQVPLGLDGPGRLALEELGEVLGRYDGDGQREALAHTRAELSRALEQAREAREKQGRMYQVLGITAGAFLVILLL